MTRGRPPERRVQAGDWLTTHLTALGGTAEAETILAEAAEQGIAGRTLRRAANDIGVIRLPPGGGLHCEWQLPWKVKA